VDVPRGEGQSYWNISTAYTPQEPSESQKLKCDEAGESRRVRKGSHHSSGAESDIREIACLPKEAPEDLQAEIESSSSRQWFLPMFTNRMKRHSAPFAT
jgi:hypothetical protein